jgi:fructose-bisphosphate aldolase class 1
MSNQVRVIDNISGTVLFETTIEKMAEAYAFAAMMEEEGLDIKIDAPGLAETLIQSLGADATEIAEYKESMDREIEDHIDNFDDSGCALCPPPKNSK